MVEAGEWVGFALGVEDDQGDGDLVERELVDQAVAGLAGQVPQQGLAGEGLASVAGLLGLEGPHVALVG